MISGISCITILCCSQHRALYRSVLSTMLFGPSKTELNMLSSPSCPLPQTVHLLPPCLLSSCCLHPLSHLDRNPSSVSALASSGPWCSHWIPSAPFLNCLSHLLHLSILTVILLFLFFSVTWSWKPFNFEHNRCPFYIQFILQSEPSHSALDGAAAPFRGLQPENNPRPCTVP